MKKILIVEDQRMPRENMERMIAESGRYESAASATPDLRLRAAAAFLLT